MQPESNELVTIDLREYMAIFRRRKWSVFLVAVVVTGAAMAYAFRATAVYTSTSRVQILPIVPAGSTPSLASINVDTERALVDSAVVASRVHDALGLKLLPVQILKYLRVSVEAKTEILDISYTSPDPATAQRMSQAFAEAYLSFRALQANSQVQAQINTVNADIQVVANEIASYKQQLANAVSQTDKSKYSLLIAADTGRLAVLEQKVADLGHSSSLQSTGTVVQPAGLPHTPSNPSAIKLGVIALILGLALGVGLAFFRERLDERVAVGENLERALGAPTLAAIPHVQSWRNRNEPRTVTVTEPDGESAEAYRTARTSLLFLMRETDAHVIEITGPIQNEGKTTTTANLAVALARGGKRVVAISCDLRKPRLHRFFGLDNSIGLSSVLSGETDIAKALIQTDVPNLRVMTSGPLPGNPELLGSVAMDDLMARLRDEADVVLVDTPAALIVSDALELAPKVDGILLVANAALSNRGSIAQTRQRLERAGGTIIAGILNDLDPSKGRRHRGYGYGGSHPRFRYRGEEPSPDMKPIVADPETDAQEPGTGGPPSANAKGWAATAAAQPEQRYSPRPPPPGARRLDP